MLKIILFITLLLAGALAFVWFKYPKVVRPVVSPLLSHITEKKSDSEGFGRETVQEKKNNLLMDAKVSAEDGSKKAVEEAKDKVYDTAKSTLDIVFNKQDEKSVNVNVLGDSIDSSENNIFDIPLNSGTNLNLSLKRNTDYFLRFQNVPENFCLYINDSKYPLEQGKAIKISFTSSGKYSIKANSCDLNDKVLGEFTVE